ncbi:hypothetical protein RhiXN_11296 [Rhizoctonia solani]|uniref:Uncharacterized protein n=1 Tax=Rhizoctonia solani TaxID=456999 RepID=A0A8H8T0G6_9AGAM|nr:uncharacterized protein RhiXN_11296 [Rhizoctonia solani]QRW24384.1 hypothetical protein RhiXN_11296 [Rhizoctonia solani]
MNIHGRDDNNPLKYALQSYSFIDWFAQNLHDIVVDIGWTANVYWPSLPEELKRSTMLFCYAPMQELLRPGYKTLHFDRYCSSFAVVVDVLFLGRMSGETPGLPRFSFTPKIWY